MTNPTQRILVAGGTGQVTSLHTKATPTQEYVDQGVQQKKDGLPQNMNAVVMNDQLYRKQQTTNFHTGVTNTVSSKSGQSAATAKSLNAIQGRFMMQSNGEHPGKYAAANGPNAYAEQDGQASTAGIKLGPG